MSPATPAWRPRPMTRVRGGDGYGGRLVRCFSDHAFGGAVRRPPTDARSSSSRARACSSTRRRRTSIGKTTLVCHFLAEADERCVLGVSGDEAEAGLPFGVLAQLLAAATTTPAGVAAVEVAGEGPADPLAAGAVLLDLLGALQHRDPVVVVVDDLHWADQPS